MWNSQLPFTTRDASLGKYKSKKRLWILQLMAIVAKIYTLMNVALLSIGTLYINCTQQPPFALFCLCVLEVTAIYYLSKNWYFFYTILVPHFEDTEQRLCQICNRQVPLKSHHCVLCNVCVLQRDHHCFFLGRCVDKFNIYYFLRFCFHASWSCFLALFFFLRYTSENYKAIWSQDFVYYIIPLSFVKFLTKEVSLFEFILVLGCNISFTTALFTSTMLIYQSYINYKNKQTPILLTVLPLREFVINCRRLFSFCKSVVL